MGNKSLDLHPSLDELKKVTGGKFASVDKVYYPWWVRRSGSILSLLLALLIAVLICVPWQQTSYATGAIVPYHPNERLQKITAPIKGIIFKWFVVEGSKVKEGDPIAEIRDIDPLYLDRLEGQKDAAVSALEAAEVAVETSQKNLERQEKLAAQGIKSQRDFELARLEYNKFVANAAAKRKDLADIETKIARQASQMVTAPRDGTIMRLYFPQGGVFVKGGDEIATIAPEASQRVVELYARGNDLPFIQIGTRVRMQFEGWPAVQVSGWPSTAIGTFHGRVEIIDPSESEEGLFRIFVFPEPEVQLWPAPFYLRQGVRVKGWFLLSTVPLGYELWRKFNDFPPTMETVKGKKKKNSLGLTLGKNVGKLAK